MLAEPDLGNVSLQGVANLACWYATACIRKRSAGAHCWLHPERRVANAVLHAGQQIWASTTCICTIQQVCDGQSQWRTCFGALATPPCQLQIVGLAVSLTLMHVPWQLW